MLIWTEEVEEMIGSFDNRVSFLPHLLFFFKLEDNRFTEFFGFLSIVNKNQP